MFDLVHPDWQGLFNSQQELLLEITGALGEDCVPISNQIFRAFEVSPRDYRALIIGQDPYPNPAHATGLAFAVPKGTRPLPPSLVNIISELESDLGVKSQGEIALWQQSGVMLLNRHLTTRANQTGADFKLGWDRFTREAVRYLVTQRQGKLVAILWGSRAQELRAELSGAKVISSVHPSPLSAYRGFFGSKPFSRCNQALLELGEEIVDWSC